MPMTPAQREWRRKHIGASDSPAIMGVSPWAGPADVYWSKVAEAVEDETDAMQAGNLLEAPILDWCRQQLDAPDMRRNVQLVSKGQDEGILSATLDALIYRRDGGYAAGVQAKYTSQPEEWGEEGTDQVPDHVIIQTQHEMHVAGVSLVYVPVLIIKWRGQFKLYKVVRNQRLIDEIVRQDMDFWNSHVLPKAPPDDAPPPMHVLEQAHRVEGKMVDLDDDALAAVEDLEIQKAAAKHYADEADRAKRALIERLGDAEAGRLPDGRIVKWQQVSQQRIDSKLLKAEYPDVADAVSKTGTYRRLNIVKGGKK